jgi:hypothetical protein
VALSRHRWQTALNVALAGVGSTAIIVTIRAYPEVARGLGTQGAGTVAAVCGIVAVACLLAALSGFTGGHGLRADSASRGAPLAGHRSGHRRGGRFHRRTDTRRACVDQLRADDRQSGHR